MEKLMSTSVYILLLLFVAMNFFEIKNLVDIIVSIFLDGFLFAHILVGFYNIVQDYVIEYIIKKIMYLLFICIIIYLTVF
jgi:hypothetical protein